MRPAYPSALLCRSGLFVQLSRCRINKQRKSRFLLNYKRVSRIKIPTRQCSGVSEILSPDPQQKERGLKRGSELKPVSVAGKSSRGWTAEYLTLSTVLHIFPAPLFSPRDGFLVQTTILTQTQELPGER